ncbi:MAG TPA: hypothetical protein VFY99_07755 [Solirubrobacterales bacterium]
MSENGAGSRGAASVESVGLALLIVLLVSAVAAAVATGRLDGGRELASTLGRKIRCATQLPGPCWRDPLTTAYGRPVAGLVRALAPAPAEHPGPAGAPLVPVDFRVCRSASCATSTGSPRLTASNRRITAFTSVRDRRAVGGGLAVTYWLYRPTLGWERIERRASPATVAAAASTPLLETQDPALTPLETLAGRNHYEFAPGEEPPWRWRVESTHPGV